ncbi:MAG TPA: hypothetical protein VGR76_05590, partial [Candidatus Angelobacter sp.]|nr:hypothetical protein [Candidatus Angelobacter sp.]
FAVAFGLQHFLLELVFFSANPVVNFLQAGFLAGLIGFADDGFTGLVGFFGGGLGLLERCVDLGDSGELFLGLFFQGGFQPFFGFESANAKILVEPGGPGGKIANGRLEVFEKGDGLAGCQVLTHNLS